MRSSSFIAFNRTKSQFLSGGSRAFAINTNGGFTAVVFMAFTGTSASNERVFEFGNANAISSISMSRSGTTANIVCRVHSSAGVSLLNLVTTTSPIIAGEWAVYTMRYATSGNAVRILKNGVVIGSGTTSSTLPNMVVSSSFIGNGFNSSMLNGNIAGFYVYDRSLSDAQLALVSNQLTLKG